MRKIIEDIYTGRLSAGNRTFKRGSEYEKALSELVKREERAAREAVPRRR